MKFKILRLYRDQDIPDHSLQEVQDVTERLGFCVQELSKKHDLNIILSALNRFHAAFIVFAVTKEGLEDAAQTEAVGLLKNIDHLAGTNYFGE